MTCLNKISDSQNAMILAMDLGSTFLINDVKLKMSTTTGATDTNGKLFAIITVFKLFAISKQEGGYVCDSSSRISQVHVGQICKICEITYTSEGAFLKLTIELFFLNLVQ